MRSPSQALLLAVLMASLILPPGLPVAKAAPVRPARKAQGQIQTRRMLLVGDSLSIDDALSRIFALVACHAQVRAGDSLTPSEVATLVRAVVAQRGTHFCPTCQRIEHP